MKVEDVRLRLLIPAGGLVDEGHQVLCVGILMAAEQSLQLLRTKDEEKCG